MRYTLNKWSSNLSHRKRKRNGCAVCERERKSQIAPIVPGESIGCRRCWTLGRSSRGVTGVSTLGWVPNHWDVPYLGWTTGLMCSLVGFWPHISVGSNLPLHELPGSQSWPLVWMMKAPFYGWTPPNQESKLAFSWGNRLCGWSVYVFVPIPE